MIAWNITSGKKLFLCFMKALKYLAIVSCAFIGFAACQKELSFENSIPPTAAAGSLKSLSGNCMPITVNGKYAKNLALTDSNSVVVQVNITTPGSYIISTDTANGFSFHGSGIIADSGLQSVILKGTGTPVAAQPVNFTVSFDSTVCMFSVNVSDSLVTPPVTSADYFPTTDSSNWTYEFDQTAGDTVRATVAKTDTTIAGNTYRTFVFSPDDYNSFYRKGGGLYYEYGNLVENLNIQTIGTITDSVDYIFLKDNVPVGSTWESPEVNAAVASVPGKLKILFTIEGKDVQDIGTTINDSVIQVKREYMFAPGGSAAFQPVATGSFSYAKNIGFVKAEFLQPFSINIAVAKWEIYY